MRAAAVPGKRRKTSFGAAAARFFSISATKLFLATKNTKRTKFLESACIIARSPCHIAVSLKRAPHDICAICHFCPRIARFAKRRAYCYNQRRPRDYRPCRDRAGGQLNPSRTRRHRFGKRRKFLERCDSSGFARVSAHDPILRPPQAIPTAPRKAEDLGRAPLFSPDNPRDRDPQVPAQPPISLPPPDSVPNETPLPVSFPCRRASRGGGSGPGGSWHPGFGASALVREPSDDVSQRGRNGNLCGSVRARERRRESGR